MFLEKKTTFPGWTQELLKLRGEVYPSLESRMALAIELARRNVENRTGGPFGAAIFESQSGKLVSVGVNLVVSSACSLAHAEMIAFASAQARTGSFDLGAEGLPEHQLVTSAQMCAMCFGATLWAGVRSVIYAATSQDVEELAGFDEGPIPADWTEQLERRGIKVTGPFQRETAREVLAAYKDGGGVVYNGRGGILGGILGGIRGAAC